MQIGCADKAQREKGQLLSALTRTSGKREKIGIGEPDAAPSLRTREERWAFKIAMSRSGFQVHSEECIRPLSASSTCDLLEESKDDAFWGITRQKS